MTSDAPTPKRRLGPLPATPKPDPRPVVPDDEEWEAWCQHPITRFVAAAMLRGAEMQRDAWTAESWNSGSADPTALAVYRTRADAYAAFLETGLERYVEILQA